MENTNQYEIQFSGLSHGVHHFEFVLDYLFFQKFGYLRFDGVEGIVFVELEKTTTMMLLNFKSNPTINTECDRCGDGMLAELEVGRELIVKFGEDQVDDDENVIFVSSTEYKLELDQHIYESLVLAIPSRLIHNQGDCNQQVIERLEKNDEDSHQEIDLRWEALKKIKR